MTKITMAIAALAPVGLLAIFNGAFWGNLAVLALTVGIFFGTLSLGRRAEASRSSESTASRTLS